MKKFLYTSLLVLGFCLSSAAFANEGNVHLDAAPINPQDKQSLQRGAQVFANYCLNCHGASFMRYNKLQDIGLSDAEIKEYLIFDPSKKVGDLMTVSMKAADAAEWLGAAPPDLSLIARARGEDWLYTYLRGFYRDETRPTGWNNTVFPQVGMPHALWELQGEQILASHKDEHGHEQHELKLVKAGTLTTLKDGEVNTVAYDAKVADLVNFLSFVSEPAQTNRRNIGAIVLLFLMFVLVPVTYLLKKEYWKDIH